MPTCIHQPEELIDFPQDLMLPARWSTKRLKKRNMIKIIKKIIEQKYVSRETGFTPHNPQLPSSKLARSHKTFVFGLDPLIAF